LKPTRGEGNFSILTHPYLMSVLAYHDTTSPIHRGVFLIRFLLGRTLRPPADAIAPLSPDLLPDLTTRERVALQTSPDDCQGCHIKINGLGFAMENYDAVGRFRTHEGKKPINALGNYTSRLGETQAFRGAEELAAYMVSSEDTHQAFATRLFHHFVKQPPAAFGKETLDRLVQRFRETNYSIKDLIAEVAVIAALHDSHPTAEDS
jgi:hypothetical protein